jgi:hypothetical protein
VSLLRSWRVGDLPDQLDPSVAHPDDGAHGRYTVVLKFAEVAFREPNKKIFNVILNEKHAVVKDLDIFSKVGHAAAHDEYISFTIKNNVLK